MSRRRFVLCSRVRPDADAIGSARVLIAHIGGRMRDMRFILQRRSARASVHFAMGVGILFWNVQSAQCEQPGTPAEVKQPATAHARSRPSTTSDGSAQLLSAILGGVESCAQDVVTGEFEAMETTGVSSVGT